jgi:hypothetical protein
VRNYTYSDTLFGYRVTYQMFDPYTPEASTTPVGDAISPEVCDCSLGYASHYPVGLGVEVGRFVFHQTTG